MGEHIIQPDSKSTAAGSVSAVNALQSPVEREDRLPEQPVQWLGLMVAAAGVGAAAGLVGTAFRWILLWAYKGRLEILHYLHGHVSPIWGWIIPMVVCSAAGALALWLTQRFAPHTAGSGIPRVESVLRAHLRPAAGLILPIKFIGGVLAIGSGMALGREGPTVQMGGTIGKVVGDTLRKMVPEPWTLIAAGAGAGLSVAFNAPLAAALFVMEELLHRFSTRVFSATLIACISSTLVFRAFFGNVTEFRVIPIGFVSAAMLPEYLLLGIAAGFLGVTFNVGLLQTLKWFDRARTWPRGSKGALAGLAVGLTAWFAPRAVGGGEELARLAIDQQFLWQIALGLILTRLLLTMASYGCGAPGGIFAPLLALGALLGNVFAIGASHIGHGAIAPSPYAIVAMAALFTAVVRSPLTGVVLLLEMTGAWALILPMMAASLTAFIVPELMGNPPIYDSLRRRDEALERSG
ncbi:MAG TPA: H(+)/Cl(-) exchange transporter ClcA [Tepidisphaeraceae bacterium]|jgi:CIC family chloride channel protein